MTRWSLNIHSPNTVAFTLCRSAKLYRCRSSQITIMISLARRWFTAPEWRTPTSNSAITLPSLNIDKGKKQELHNVEKNQRLFIKRLTFFVLSMLSLGEELSLTPAGKMSTNATFSDSIWHFEAHWKCMKKTCLLRGFGSISTGSLCGFFFPFLPKLHFSFPFLLSFSLFFPTFAFNNSKKKACTEQAPKEQYPVTPYRKVRFPTSENTNPDPGWLSEPSTWEDNDRREQGWFFFFFFQVKMQDNLCTYEVRPELSQCCNFADFFCTDITIISFTYSHIFPVYLRENNLYMVLYNELNDLLLQV